MRQSIRRGLSFGFPHSTSSYASHEPSGENVGQNAWVSMRRITAALNGSYDSICAITISLFHGFLHPTFFPPERRPFSWQHLPQRHSTATRYIVVAFLYQRD